MSTGIITANGEGGGGKGGSCHEVTIVNFRFHESRNKNSLVLNSLRSPEKSDHSSVKFSYELNFRHSRFISYLFTIHSQGLLHFTPHGKHFNHDSWNRFLSNHDSQSTKKPDYSVTKIPLPPPPPPPLNGGLLLLRVPVSKQFPALRF